MQLRVPSLQPGERSLPAEMRTYPGYGFAQRRMFNGLAGAGISGLGEQICGTDADGVPYCEVLNTDPLPPITPPVIDPGSSGGIVTFPQYTGLPSDIATTVAPYATSPSGYTGPTVVAPTAATPAAPSGYQWATLINQSGQNLAKILTIAQGGSSVTLPNGTQLLYGSSGSAAASSALSSIAGATGLSSNTLILVGVGLVAFMVLGGRK